MKDVRNIIFSLTVIGVLFIMTGTFSYFVVGINGSINGTTNNFVFNVTGFNNETNKVITLTNPRGGIMPGDSGSFTLTLNMSGTENDIVYSVNINRTNLPIGLGFFYDEEHLSKFVNYSEFVAENSTMNKVITVYWYWNPNVDNDNDNLFINTTISASIDINVEQQVYGTMKNGHSASSEFWSSTYKPYVRTISFRRGTSEVPSTCDVANLCWDISASGTQEYHVYAYMIDSGFKNINTDYTIDAPLYNLYIACDREIYAPSSCDSLFYHMKNLININFNDNYNTSNVTSMRYVFSECSSLTSLDLSNFNTSKVTNMESMFWRCSSLTSLGVSNFNTSNVTDTNYMFSECSSLISLDVGNFNTSNVINMDYMFGSCGGLTNLDVSNFNTSNVIDMDYMFGYCWGLTSLDLNCFSTGNVTDMSFMFRYCSNLASLDLSSFNTNNVTSMSYMFEGCSSLTNIDLSSFNTSNVTGMKWMFEGCSSLTSLDLSGFDMASVTNTESMFDDCLKLSTTINMNGASIAKYDNMFYEAATDPSALITVNYTATTSTLVDNMIATKSHDSNVVKGSLIS